MFLIQKLKNQYKAQMARAYTIRAECKQYGHYKPEEFEPLKNVAVHYVQDLKRANNTLWGRFKTLIPFTANYRLARQAQKALDEFDRALAKLEKNIQEHKISSPSFTRPRSQSVDADLPKKIIPFNDKSYESINSFFVKKSSVHEEIARQTCKVGFYR